METLKEKKQKSNNIKSGLTTASVLVLIMFLLTSFSMDVFAQTNLEPVMPSNQIPIGKSYNPENPFPDQWNYFPQLKNPLLNINHQTQQQNRQQMERVGHQPPPSQHQMTVDYYDKHAIDRQRKEQQLYQLINSSNSNLSNQSTISPEFNSLFLIADTNTTIFKNHSQQYKTAYNEISGMLSGKKELNLKRAVFVVENAYHQNKLSYDKYNKQIAELVLICKQILKEKGLRSDNYMACHFTIQKLFSEKFTYKNSAGKTIQFIPFGYDFDDYMGKDDHTKMFVTKLLDTKTGQCHSLPLLYLIIAEELNINAYLGLAPNHSYVKFGNQYQSYNFETTNGTFVTDEWIVKSGYISSTAMKNQIYLAPLTKQQVIAECLVDLSAGLDSYFGKSNFTIKCANTALNYFPNSIRSLMTIHNYIVAHCANTAKKYNFPKEMDYHKYPELKKKFDNMVEFELEIEQTGYIKIPPEQYEQWQLTTNEEKQRQEHLKQLNKLQQSANEH